MKSRPMRLPVRISLIMSTLAVVVTASFVAYGAQEHQHPSRGGAHRHADAAKLKNPVPPDTASIAAGQTLFQKYCAGCHGETGKGDGMMGEELDPKPSDLTDAEWTHGPSDGEIFTAIRDGIKGTGMRAFARKMTVHQVWDVVNYLRSIGPKPAKSH